MHSTLGMIMNKSFYESSRHIKYFLIEQGSLDESRVSAIGHGSASPIRFPELTEEDKHTNRRVEFEIKHNDERQKESLDFNLDEW